VQYDVGWLEVRDVRRERTVVVRRVVFMMKARRDEIEVRLLFRLD
jgi:hypothetical protein